MLPHSMFTQAGPILRYLTATEIFPEADMDHAALLSDLLACPEVCRWLNLLGRGPVHHSMDASAENALAKLGEYGLRAGIPALDEHALPYCAVGEGERYYADALVLVPFLIRTGYAAHPSVAHWIAQRIDILYQQACSADYDLYLDDAGRACLSPAQRASDKRFYHPRYSHHWGVLCLPTCYDLYALAYLPGPDPSTREKVEVIIKYLLDPAFQDTPGGFIWNPELRRVYAAGRVFLACLPREHEREKLVLFLEMLAHFAAGRASPWFQQGMAHLETFRTGEGTYRFPARYLSEKSSYYLYAGMHMGLGETPRSAQALERESSFRMVRLRRRMEG